MFAGLKELWCEGNLRLDETACFMGVARGNDVPTVARELASRRGWFERGLSADSLSYKGCRLFLDEDSARELNG